MALPQSEQLPSPIGPIIGRDRLIDQAIDLLVAGETRLITLAGPGGIGKTRLAIAIAHRLMQEREVAVSLVPLDAVAEPGELAAAIARTVGLSDQIEDVETALIRYLAAETRAFILDSFEQVMPAVPTLNLLLTSCPGIQVMVTTREAPLHLTGERVLEVEPLGYPGEAEAENGSIRPGSFPAIQFFLQCAPSVRWSESGSAVVQLCRRLRGIPLALEMAASRVGLLSVEEIAEQTTGWLPILTHGRHDTPLRHQSMEQSIDWSYRLLDPELQRVFRALGVFAASFSRDAATTVAQATPGQLTALLECRLIHVVPGHSRSPRFAFSEPVREFAWREAEHAGETAQIHRVFANWAIDFARSVGVTSVAPPIYSFEGRSLETLLKHERANLLVALSWLLAQEDRDGSLAIASMLLDYWFIALRPGEGLPWMTATLELADGGELVFSREYVRVLIGHALLSQMTGASGHALRSAEMAVTLAQNAGEIGPTSESLAILGYVTLNRHDYQRSIECSFRALRILRTPEFEDRPWQAGILQNIALAAIQINDLEMASDCAEESLALEEASYASFGHITALRVLGDVRAHQGRFVDAIQAHTDAFAACVVRYGRSNPEIWPHIAQGFAAGATIAWLAFPEEPALAANIALTTERICARLGVAKPENRISYERMREHLHAAGLLAHVKSASRVSTLTLQDSLVELRATSYELRRRLASDSLVFPQMDRVRTFQIDADTPNVLAASISPIQLATIRAIVNGKSVKQIALEDGVQQSSVYSRINVIRQKWGLPAQATLTDLVVFAVRHGVA